MADAQKSPAARTRWWASEAAPGALLLGAAVLSFVIFNSPLSDAFSKFMHARLGLRLGDYAPSTDFSHFIADALMALFFLFVGLELKRESIEGPFRNPGEAALPFFGALGGMAIPALVYLAIAAPADAAYARGWAIPAATDIAFALGALALLGKRAPAGLRLFLLALAIIDDLGAVLVIAVFYTDNVHGWALGGAALTFLAMLGLNAAGVSKRMPYFALGVLLWWFVSASGVHATIAGVLAALTIPMRDAKGGSPLVALEHDLKPYVQLGVLPLFALAHAGAPLGDGGLGALAHPVSLAVMGGLVIGKPLGIVTAVLLGARLMKRAPPVKGQTLIGGALLAGIGFTMSLFIGGLAFGDGPEAAPLRLGVLCGSALAALLGLALLARANNADGGDANWRDQESIAEKEGLLDAR